MQLNYEFDRQLELERADAIEEGITSGCYCTALLHRHRLTAV